MISVATTVSPVTSSTLTSCLLRDPPLLRSIFCAVSSTVSTTGTALHSPLRAVSAGKPCSFLLLKKSHSLEIRRCRAAVCALVQELVPPAAPLQTLASSRSLLPGVVSARSIAFPPLSTTSLAAPCEPHTYPLANALTYAQTVQRVQQRRERVRHSGCLQDSAPSRWAPWIAQYRIALGCNCINLAGAAFCSGTVAF